MKEELWIYLYSNITQYWLFPEGGIFHYCMQSRISIIQWWILYVLFTFHNLNSANDCALACLHSWSLRTVGNHRTNLYLQSLTKPAWTAIYLTLCWQQYYTRTLSNFPTEGRVTEGGGRSEYRTDRQYIVLSPLLNSCLVTIQIEDLAARFNYHIWFQKLYGNYSQYFTNVAPLLWDYGSSSGPMDEW